MEGMAEKTWLVCVNDDMKSSGLALDDAQV